jgi:hypothetical protein
MTDPVYSMPPILVTSQDRCTNIGAFIAIALVRCSLYCNRSTNGDIFLTQALHQLIFGKLHRETQQHRSLGDPFGGGYLWPNPLQMRPLINTQLDITMLIILWY